MREALTLAYGALTDSETPHLDSQILLAHVLRRERSWVLAHDDHELSETEWAEYRESIAYRSQGVPVAYLRSEVEWFDLSLTVTPGVLVPRPDTEVLVERAIELVRMLDARSIADIGTGSGAIAVAMACALPAVTVKAVDVSAAVLKIARLNAERYGVADRITLHHGSLIAPLSQPPDLLLANLPYLSADLMSSVSRDVRWEPALALDGGQDGTAVYEALLDGLRWRGWDVPMLLEIDPSQEERMRDMVHAAHPGGYISIVKDLGGRSRVIEYLPEGTHDRS